MTHTPPVPTGNQSPYPRVEPPHLHEAGVADPRPAPPPPRSAGLIAAGVGAVLAIGSAAVIAGIAYARGRPAPKRVRSR